ncbi:LysR family transcriptional regulator [Pseudoduganella sp. FT26W]|uniref:LysR family transcriptional regulator n=2 Tax=Duganella aquatilis TaxID=2666082 RepID=A0A844D5H1_9BURK|nr:LysR family transcriptional regulator [Duganella aquatilis]
MKTILSTEDMRIFLWVARLSSFTRAAEQLQVPRTSISNAIQRLEERLGARLLQRTTRRVQVTREGEELLERCERLLDDLDEIGALFQQGSQLSGRIRADMPLGMADVVLPRLLEFLQAHPALQIDIFSTDRRVDLLGEGFDVVVRAGPVVDESLVSRTLFELHLLNVASPGYVAAHGMPALDQLSRHWLINYQPNPASQPAVFEYQQAGATVQAPMPYKVTVNNSMAYTAACCAGLGIAQIPRSRALAEITAGRMVEVLPQHLAAPMTVRLLFPHRRNIPQRVRVFADWLRDMVAAAA